MDEAAITRAELLEGLPGRRTSTLLFAIESRTAQRAVEAGHAAAPAICEGMAERRERAFLAALRAGARMEHAPAIQALERFAEAWAHLVPPDAATRADLAGRLGDRHRFRAGDVPAIRECLGLDAPGVQAAFEARHGRPLASIYARTLPPRERARWARSRLAARLEGLPPFWTAYSLTLTQTVGAGVLALPIALARIGPLAGVALLAVLGLVNVVTALAVAESFARTGSVRWGGAYFGRVVAGHLGGLAGGVLSVTLAGLSIVALLAYYVGFATTLGDATPLPVAAWAGVLFAVTAAFVWRGRLEATVVSALAVGAVNILVIVVLSAVAFGRVDLGNLAFPALSPVELASPAIVGLVFGVALLAFFGHTAVANGARVVLRRDPSGRSLVRGTAAAMLTVILLYGLWTIAVGGAVEADRLAAETGTALIPLAEVVGPVVLVVGAVFVVLAMGMAAVHFSIGLHFQTCEVLGRTDRTGRLLGFAPLLGVLVAVEWLVLTGRESFTGALGLVGTLTAPLLAGIFPVLLVAATRRRGDYVPAGTLRLLGRPAVLAVVYALFLLAVLAHGAVIWEAPVERALAFGTAAAVAAVTVSAARRGAFRPRATVELRHDRDVGRLRLRLVVGGQRARATVRLRGAGGDTELELDGGGDLPPRTAAVVIDLAPLRARELRVWLHEVEPSGATRPLAARVALRRDGEAAVLALDDGEAVARLDGPPSVLELDLGVSRPAPGGAAP